MLAAGAQQELCELATKACHSRVDDAALGKSVIPETHLLCLGMGGMHGEAYANYALQHAI